MGRRRQRQSRLPGAMRKLRDWLCRTTLSDNFVTSLTLSTLTVTTARNICLRQRNGAE